MSLLSRTRCRRMGLSKNACFVKWLSSAGQPLSSGLPNDVPSDLPSGWKPPSDQPLKQVPFMVRRTKSNNLPVYLDYRNGRARILTIIRKIEGDPLALESMLRDHLNIPDVLSRVDELTSQVILKGDYREEAKLFLRSLGF